MSGAADQWEDHPQQEAPPAAAAPADEWEDQWEDATPSQPVAQLSWGDVAKGAVTNAPHSAKEFAHSVVQPFIHPVETAKSLGRVGLGAAEYAGIGYGKEHEKYVDAVGKFFADRYGGAENFKRTLAVDPVGALGDLSMFLTGGETALARVPGFVGRVGEAAGAVSRAVDPLNAVAKVASPVANRSGSALAHAIGDVGTHTGAESLKTATRAGYEGGEGAKAFQENLRGTAEMRDPVDEARQAVTNMRITRGQRYRDAMADIGANQQIYPGIWQDIAGALTDAGKIKNFKGQDLSPTTREIRQRIAAELGDWWNLPASDYHTLEGFDALKQKIGDIRDGTQYGTPERKVADTVYMAIRNSIAKADPAYAKAMEGYEKASHQIRDIEKTLSLNPNATIDTSLRKLQSVLRDNVNTSFGRRAELAKYLVDAGAPNLMERLAGQALKPWTPRGLGKLSVSLAAEMAALAAGHMAGIGPAALVTLPMMSPRVMGEAAYYSGKLAGYFPGVRSQRAAFQVGRQELANDPAQQTQPRRPLQIEVTKPPSGIPPKEERHPGQVFQTPRGPLKWTGTGWVHA